MAWEMHKRNKVASNSSLRLEMDSGAEQAYNRRAGRGENMAFERKFGKKGKDLVFIGTVLCFLDFARLSTCNA